MSTSSSARLEKLHAFGQHGAVGSLSPGLQRIVTEPETKEKKTKVKNEQYERILSELQEELVKMQAWVRAKGLKVVIIFEGRDAAGKGKIL
jgi:polyphosphate kinase 2 (PPK2 family)